MKRVLDGIAAVADRHKKSMPRDLADSFEAYWPAFNQQIRQSRNAAGHPSATETSPESVQHSLIFFPHLVRLKCRLAEWIEAEMA